MINKEHYAKEVKGFCEIAKKLPKDCQPESAIFAPYTFEKYAEAPKRIFFVGIDSAGWINFKEMLEDYNNNNVEHYLEKNTKVVSVQGENKDGTDKAITTDKIAITAINSTSVNPFLFFIYYHPPYSSTINNIIL